MKCPDCKDGFYYPLVGPPEPCLTCATSADIPVIFVPKDQGMFVCNDQWLGKILEINVLSHHLLAVAFDGDKIVEFTDPKSKEFQAITGGGQPRTWWGNQYLVEHAAVGLAKFNYKPTDFVYHFHGPCEVTLEKLTSRPPLTFYRKIMKQL